MRRLTTIIAAVLMLTVPQAPNAGASSTTRLTVLYFDEDKFYNYDFNSQSVSASNVDWGISLMFWNNAEVDKIKNTLNSPYNATGSTKYARVNDGGYGLYDADSGKKTLKCPIYEQSAKHFRLYAPSTFDNFYTPYLGYYVIGSTHIDYAECTPDRYYGSSEVTEDDVAYQSRRHGWNTLQDFANFENYEAFRQEGNHGWNSDGFATYISVP